MPSVRGTTQGSVRLVCTAAAEAVTSAVEVPQTYANPIVRFPVAGTVRTSLTHRDELLRKAIASGASWTSAEPCACFVSLSLADAYLTR